MSKTDRVLKLGTRGSALALWQANWTKGELERRIPDLQVELKSIKTSGDRIQNVPLAEVGGKGLFTKELDESLLEGRIDFAVHSLKDLPFDLPSGTTLAGVSKREDPRDAFVSDGRRLREMHAGARIGTSSLRRQAQILHRFPDFNILPLRGNVDTRLRKLDRGEFDGIILAVAGLKRLGHESRISEYLEADVMLSAIGQGALAFVCRSDDARTRDTLATLDDADTHQAVLAERALMASLEGSCQVPIGGWARLDGDQLVLDGLIASPDGKQIVADRIRGAVQDASELGFELGSRLRSAGADVVLKAIQQHGT